MAAGLALVARSVPTCPSGRRGFLRGRRGTWRHSSSFHMAGVALGDIHLRFTWQVWYSTYSLCVGVARMALAGVALGDIHLRFTWQAWYSTYSLCVAGVARMALG